MARLQLIGLLVLAGGCDLAAGIEAMPLGSDLVPTHYDDACRACIDVECAAQEEACLASPGCYQAAQCFQERGCQDPECLLACVYDAPTSPATSTTNGFHTCWNRCDDVCPIGREWGCRSTYGWGRPAQGLEVIEQSFIVKTSSLASENPTAEIPATDFLVEACLSADEECEDPVAQVHTDAAGLANFGLPLTTSFERKTGWSGFLQFSSEFNPPFPTRFHYGRPLVRAESQVGVTVVPHFQFVAAVAEIGVTLNDEAGQVGALVFDCLFQEARGVRLTLDEAGFLEDTVPLLLVNESGGLTFDDDPEAVTDANGGGGFLNVAPGRRTIEATRGGQVVARVEIDVRPGELALTQVFPPRKE